MCVRLCLVRIWFFRLGTDALVFCFFFFFYQKVYAYLDVFTCHFAVQKVLNVIRISSRRITNIQAIKGTPGLEHRVSFSFWRSEFQKGARATLSKVKFKLYKMCPLYVWLWVFAYGFRYGSRYGFEFELEFEFRFWDTYNPTVPTVPQ